MMKEIRRTNLEHVKLVVVKLGSAVLTDNGHLNASFFTRFASEIAELRGLGYSFIVVTSGAVDAGLEALGFTAPPMTIPEKKA